MFRRKKKDSEDRRADERVKEEQEYSSADYERDLDKAALALGVSARRFPPQSEPRR